MTCTLSEPDSGFLPLTVSIPVTVSTTATGTVTNNASLTGASVFNTTTAIDSVTINPLALAISSPTTGVSTQPVTVTLTGQLTGDVDATLMLSFVSNTTDPQKVCDPSIGAMFGTQSYLVTPHLQRLPGHGDLPLTSGSVNQTLTIQTGSTAGTISLAIFVGGTSTTAVLSQQIVVPQSKPVIPRRNAHPQRRQPGIQVTSAYTNTRDLAKATFHFTAAPGQSLQTADFTIDISSLASSYFQVRRVSPRGGNFVYSQPFTLTSNATGIASVTVTLTNSTQQSSDPVTGN